MFVWCRLHTIFNKRYVLLIVGIISLYVALSTTFIFNHVSAAADINRTLSYQGRLFDSAGTVVPDGYYNMQFKLYQDGTGTAAGNSGGTLKWTESYVNNGGTSGVRIKNGYFSVQLGSNTPFGSSVDWNQDTLWLSMNIAGYSASCTSFGSAPCTADGEMLPMKRLTAVPQAMNSNAVGGKTADNLVQLSQGVQTDTSNNSSIHINKVGGGNLVQLQNTATDVFTIGNTGSITLGNVANQTISVAPSSGGANGKSLTVSAGSGGNDSANVGGELVLMGGMAGGTAGHGDNGPNALDFEDFEGETNNTTITTAKSTFNDIDIGSTGTATFSDEWSINGVMSGKFTHLATVTKTITPTSTFAVRTYFNMPSLPSSAVVLAQAQMESPVTAQIRLDTSGRPSLRNVYTTVTSSDTAVPTNEPVRMEWKLNDSSSVQVARFYWGANLHGTTPNITLSGLYNQGNFNKIDVGIVSGTTGFTLYIDEWAQGNDWVGPLLVANGGNVKIDAGSGQGIGEGGSIEIGTANASSIVIGSTNGSSATSIKGGSIGFETAAGQSLSLDDAGRVEVRGDATEQFSVRTGSGTSLLSVDSQSGINMGTTATIMTNSSTALTVQNTAGTSLFNTDTTDMRVTINGSIDQTGTKLAHKASLAGSTSTNYPREMDIVGNYAYVLSQGITGSFAIIDIANPASPAVIGSLSNSLLEFARDVRVSGRYAYVITYSSALVIIDVANPSAPSIAGSITNAYLNDAHGLEVQGSYVYVAADLEASPMGHFSVFDVSRPNSPTYVTSLTHNNLGDAKQVDISGRYAYVTSGLPTGGLTVIDINNPKNPVMRGSALSSTLMATARDVEVVGRYAYVAAASSDSLVILDISNPSAPSIVGSLVDSVNMDEAFDVTVNGRYAYVSGRTSNTIAVVDIADPSSPTLVSGASYTAPSLLPSSTMIKGRHLYIATNRASSTLSNFTVLDTGGATLTATSTNTLDTQTLQVHRNADIGGLLNVASSLFVGQGGIMTDGGITAGGDVTVRSTNNSAEAFKIQNSGGTGLFSVDSLNNRVQIGTGSGAGAATVFTLDKAASAPTVTDAATFFGSMYYDTTLGKVRCYEQDGWGACGAAPDSFVSLSPEYAGAVTNSNGTGTLSTGLCSDTLNLLDGSASQPTVCGTTETYNFYKWTTDQATAQTRSIYVTYKLPNNFKNFVSGSTSLMGRTDNTASTIAYQIYRNNTAGLADCGSAVATSTGTQTVWQKGTASGSADPANCSFVAGDSILVKIDMTTSSNHNAYISNLDFAYSIN